MKPFCRMIRELFGKSNPRQNLSQTAVNSRDSSSSPTCAFCGESMTEKHDSTRKERCLCLYPLWRCPCGAIGSGAWVPDLDEVSDQLLEVLGIAARVSQPCVPVDKSGVISAQYYDASAAVRSLREILGQHGYDLQTNTFRDGSASIHCLWIRKTNR